MNLSTSDLCDKYGDALQVTLPGFHDYGARRCFAGEIVTIKTHEDNSLVKQVIAEPGKARVLIVDGGASMRCALLGDMLAQQAIDNGWEGCILSGCVRDVALLAGMHIGLKALGSNPRKSIRKGAGSRDVAVRFADVLFVPGHYVYADEDGIVVSDTRLAIAS